MNSELQSLDEIGLEFGTDKASIQHGYLSRYEMFFRPLRFQKLTILEIGILGGASLKTWEKYFPNALIVGADIDHGTERFATARTKIEILDQSNIQDLVSLGIKYGPFDIIIEDGSHFWEHQITTLRTLFPFLKNGGFYIAEDLQTNYGHYVPNYRGIATQSCVEYLKRLADFCVGDDAVDLDTEEDAFLRTFGRSTKFITFFRRACLLEKQHHSKVYAYPNEPLLHPDGTDISQKLSLLCHVGHYGSIVAKHGLFINSNSVRDAFIQGFSISETADQEIDLLYRARMSDGTWSDWVGCGQFVGSAGRSLNLTGFSVRLGPGLKNVFNLRVIGAFNGETQTVIVGDGDDCLPHGPLDELKWLKGMQVIFEPR